MRENVVSHEYGITNKHFAAVAVSSLLLGAALTAAVRMSGALEVPEQMLEFDLAGTARREVAANVDALSSVASPIGRVEMAEAAIRPLVAPYGADAAVSCEFLGSGRGFDVNGSETFQSASMIKLAVLAEYLDETADGRLSPTDTYTLAAEDVVGGSGTMQDDPIGTVYALDQVASRMISVSDNVGTNALIERMGIESIDSEATELGLGQTRLAHKLMIDANDGQLNVTSANDCAALLARIARHEAANEERSLTAEDWLLAQEDAEGLAQGLPAGVPFGHKTGTVDDIRHDGGIVYAEDPYVIVVMTRNMDYDAANALMAQISSAAYAALK